MSRLLPRKILMTVDAVGGVWRYAMDLGIELQRSGIDVAFACFGPPPSPLHRCEAESIGELAVVGEPLDWMVPSAGALRAVPEAIAAIAQRTGADLLHLNLPSQAAGFEIDVPVVVVSHSCVVSWFRAVRHGDLPRDWKWQKELNQNGFAAADVVVSPSRSHADLLASCYPDLKDVAVVHNAVRPIRGPTARDDFVIAAGRWWDDGKNARTLDRAARDCRLPIKMAGSQRGPNGQHQPIGNAIALGEVSGAQVRELMSAAAAFVSPSIYEPFGLAPLEAASAGLPLVLSDIPTYRELWSGAALFAQPDDPAAFAQALNSLAQSPALRREFGERAAVRSSRFTPARQADGMRAAYATALRNRTPARERAFA